MIPKMLILAMPFWVCTQAFAQRAMDELSPGETWARNNPPSRVQAQAHPVPKDNAHPGVTVAEREAIGLPAPTWTKEGKVHPAVKAAFEEQKRIIAERPGLAWVQFDRPCGLEGMAYVDVYLRHDSAGKIGSAKNRAAIQKIQDELLSELTAAEFALVFQFKDTAGLVGYITDPGFKKLTERADVVAIGLDDQPRPEGRPHEIGAERTQEDKEKWTLAKGKLDPQVTEALEKSTDGYVFVNVVLKRPVKGTSAGQESDYDDWAAKRKLEDDVLSALSANEFHVHARGGVISGYVNASGLAKLNDHPHVVAMGLDGRATVMGTSSRGN